ncbi:MAG: hypothetical protein COY58_05170 [Gammaproteobacteria bacterium CG_4_10_14_0_8_um_filter_38_16]|nr:MAG: hypothetical protein COY58_05170 [Gammaproteobacteria bacterium CG_4_10_14_0_8_um_filter_38_16]PJA02828.1 MAG: hypothetical protein COX72_08555 [Gammaproteobacteria bacterium CG_4_10_14_0_2_um_filter_38_22]PJB10693.1 MAG: hypothetical protein CO120_03485 [Gammaproteobacteria bacterium CG_4_9_14_3_um_filter_38_9]
MRKFALSEFLDSMSEPYYFMTAQSIRTLYKRHAGFFNNSKAMWSDDIIIVLKTLVKWANNNSAVSRLTLEGLLTQIDIHFHHVRHRIVVKAVVARTQSVQNARFLAGTNKKDVYQVYLKMLSGKELSISIERTDTLLDLKKAILASEKLPIENQSILYNGKELTDDNASVFCEPLGQVLALKCA